MNKKAMVLIMTVTLPCASLPIWAQFSENGQDLRDRDEARAQTQNTQRLGDLRRANQIIGEAIMNAHDQKIGKVKDLALDLQNGRIAEVIVATGGVMGIDEKVVAVPPEKFACGRTINALQFKGDQAQLRDAAEFRLSEWNTSTDQAELRETYQRFGVDTYFYQPQQKLGEIANPGGQDSHYYSFNGQNALPHLGYISRASRLLGTTARNQQNVKLGTVNNLVMDVSVGRVVEVILAEGGLLGMHQELSAVPPQAFHWNADFSGLTLDSTKQALRTASHFRADQWGYAYEPATIAEVYHSYAVPAYFTTTGEGNGAQNVRERTDDGVTALEQGNNMDVVITEKIRKAIQTDDAVSADIGNVKIITVDGKVTLRGPVSNAQEKRMIGETAASVVSADKVYNELEVKTSPPPFHGY